MKRKILINPKYEYLRSFITALPDTFSQNGKIIYQSRNELRVFEKEGLSLNVKRFGIPLFFNRIIYNCFRLPKALRAYEYALKLQRLDISTPEAVGCICINHNGLLGSCYFISLQVPYTRRFYEFGISPIEGKEEIIRAFAQYTARMHEAGVYHKDYSPGNILFDINKGKPEFCVVDINRMKFGPVGIKEGCANFARLWGQQPFFRILATEYAEARHFDTAQCIQLVLHYRQKFWKHYSRRHPPEFQLDI